MHLLAHAHVKSKTGRGKNKMVEKVEKLYIQLIFGVVSVRMNGNNMKRMDSVKKGLLFLSFVIKNSD